ncbi:MAG: DNA repair protein RecO [Gammaproteobacteria bacterium]|nr:DNA repair protein RecO [Gammaproteobacteria bacterium]
MSKALVIKKTDYQDTSVIINVINEEGIDSLIVKGAKRKNSMTLPLTEVLTLIDYEATTSKFKALKEGVVADNFNSIKEDLFKFSIASVALDYAFSLKDAVKNEKEFYGLLISFLDELKITDNPELSLFIFEFILTRLLGVGIKKDYLIEHYYSGDELLNEIDNLIEGKTIKNKEIMRKFFIDYYKREMGLTLRSKKVYLSLCLEE